MTDPAIPQDKRWTGFSPARIYALEPVFSAIALFLVALMIQTLAAMALDDRTLLAENVWSKPLKFQFALIIYLATLVWFATWLPPGTTRKPLYRIFSLIVGFCVLAEMLWISGAAMFGIQSHFNYSNPFMATIYPVMGFFAATLTSASLVYGILIARNRDSGLKPAVQFALVIGLVLTFFLTAFVAGFLSSQGTHLIGGALPDGEGFPVMGWSRQQGDLRVAHFLSTHAMHAIPLCGLLVSGLKKNRDALLMVAGFSVAYLVLVVFSFVQALNGQPFIAFVKV
ncbi:hypothetical protein [Parasphingorhabdus sp.]|uniref:hypothetical protein n=1 Tax=Parasphingorhabdus sp. TaxID=2709688 RepID=UPI003BB0FCBB